MAEFWTPRWNLILEKGIPQLTGQRRDYWLSQARIQIAVAGRRSLKTELAKRKISYAFQFAFIENPVLSERALKNGKSDERYFYAAPTTDQVRKIAWDDLCKLTNPLLIKRIWEGDLCIELKTGQELWALGLDKPQRAEGSPWDGVVLDEFADMKMGSWEKNIRPLLSDRNGFAIILGVPDFDKKNNLKFQELFDKGQSGNDSDIVSFTWKSADVLPDEEIEKAKSELSDISFKQEYEASFLSAPGRAYSQFVHTTHVKDFAKYNPELALRVSCDFNIGNHNWGLYQVTTAGIHYAVDEIYLQNATVEYMLNELNDRLIKLQPREVVMYGDYSGQNRSAQATFSAWQQIKRNFDSDNPERIIKHPCAVEYAYQKQPPITDRINAVEGALRNVKGEIKLYINPLCKNLIRDLSQVSRTMLFSQNKSDELTHASDNLGYYLLQYKQ